MTTETMREAVARAICEVDCGVVTENELDRCRDLADAAIRTVLERLPHWRGIKDAPNGTHIVWSVCETSGQGWVTEASLDRRTGCWISAEDGIVAPTHFLHVAPPTMLDAAVREVG